MFLLCFLCTYLSGHKSSAQEKALRNDLYMEVLGNGGLGSLNYESRLGKSELLGLRVGFGLMGLDKVQPSIITALSNLIPLKQKKDAFMEMSPGLTVAFNRPYGDTGTVIKTLYLTDYIMTLTLGYRKHTSGNWMYRFSLVPGFIANRGGRFFFTAGFSIGKRF
jgi:hypothetical protein